MTLPQDTMGLMLQLGVNVLPLTLPSRILNLSIVMTHAASRPAAPVITSSRANARLPPTVRGTSARPGSVDPVETSFTVVLLITSIPILESGPGVIGHSAAPACVSTVRWTQASTHG